MDTDKKHLHQTLIIVGSLFAALFFDLLFYRKPIGISLGIFTTVLVLATFALVALVRARLTNTNPASTNSTHTCKTEIEKYSILLGICTIGFSFLTM
ncbi:MAG: hypothetical protein HY779_06230, partial [Rubrobacteridae bacterium]|nr:hypothetical protein [Rubrobacteridae bacterium]